MVKTIEVSVIVPVFNEEKYIDGMLQSLCRQTYPRDQMEWILIDGNSTDKTVDIIKSYSECPIVLLFNERRKTPVSLNMGVRAAKGEYIVRMDAHAEYPPDYIEKCIYYLKTTDADNVGGYMETKGVGFVGSATAEVLSSVFGVGNSAGKTNGKGGYVDTVQCGSFRRELFDKVGYFNEELLRSEDNDLNSRIRAIGGKIYLAEDIHLTYYCRTTIKGILKMGAQNGNALFRTLRLHSNAMRLRHFIPFFFVLSLVILPLLSISWPMFLWVLGLELLLYMILDIYFSFFRGKTKYGVITVWLYPLFHVAYGVGSLLGLFNIKLY